MPGVKNSNTIEPKALPPAARLFLTVLSLIYFFILGAGSTETARASV